MPNTQHHLITSCAKSNFTHNLPPIAVLASADLEPCNMNPSIRAARPPPSRRALFQSTRRQPPTSVVRPDTATIFQQPMDDEIVERDDKGQYIVTAPSSTYKQMVHMREGDEETGT